MAWSFDETNDNVQITDDAVLTLPDADWSLGGLVKLDDNVGTGFQYFFSWGTVSANPSVNIFFAETSQSTIPNQLKCIVRDADAEYTDGGGDGVVSSTTPGTSVDWQHILLVRSGTTLTMYVDNVDVGSATNANVDEINVAANTFMGAREDLDAGRFLGGDMAEWAKWDRALNASERQALTDGYSPAFYPHQRAWYVPMVREYMELHGLTVSNTGSTTGNHPRIIYPSAPIIGIPTAVAADVLQAQVWM
jgi:hypothetical protein